MCSNVDHTISACPATLPTTCIPTKANCAPFDVFSRVHVLSDFLYFGIVAVMVTYLLTSRPTVWSPLTSTHADFTSIARACGWGNVMPRLPAKSVIFFNASDVMGNLSGSTAISESFVLFENKRKHH